MIPTELLESRPWPIRLLDCSSVDRWLMTPHQKTEPMRLASDFG
jgi:hypothetical protein